MGLVKREGDLRWIVEREIVEPPRTLFGFHIRGEHTERTQVADIAVKGALGQLAILPLAGAYQLLDNDLQESRLPETTEPGLDVIGWDFGLYDLLGVRPADKESASKHDDIFRVIYDRYQRNSVNSSRRNFILALEEAGQTVGALPRSGDRQDARNRLQDPTLAHLIDGIAIDLEEEICDINEADQYGVQLDHPLLAEPVRRIEKQVSVGKGILKTMMQDRYYDGIKERSEQERACNKAARREKLPEVTFKELLKLKYPESTALAELEGVASDSPSDSERG